MVGLGVALVILGVEMAVLGVDLVVLSMDLAGVVMFLLVLGGHCGITPPLHCCFCVKRLPLERELRLEGGWHRHGKATDGESDTELVDRKGGWKVSPTRQPEVRKQTHNTPGDPSYLGVGGLSKAPLKRLLSHN